MDEQIRQHRMTAESRREQILDVTHAVVDAEGFHAATLGRIAAEAGITRTVVYQQFGDLPGLFVALVDREAERAGAQFTAAVAASGEPSEDDGTFGDAFAGFLRAVDTHPATWRLFLFPPEGAPPELHERLAHAQAVVVQYIADVLLEINPQLSDVEYTARILHVAGRELLRLRLTEPEAATHERLLAHVRRLSPALLRQAPRT
jgi:AcrR family transcriptional regulator